MLKEAQISNSSGMSLPNVASRTLLFSVAFFLLLLLLEKVGESSALEMLTWSKSLS